MDKNIRLTEQLEHLRVGETIQRGTQFWWLEGRPQDVKSNSGKRSFETLFELGAFLEGRAQQHLTWVSKYGGMTT